MLARRLRRRPNINPASGQRIVFAGIDWCCERNSRMTSYYYIHVYTTDSSSTGPVQPAWNAQTLVVLFNVVPTQGEAHRIVVAAIVLRNKCTTEHAFNVHVHCYYILVSSRGLSS